MASRPLDFSPIALMDVATGIIRPDANLIEAFLDRYDRPQTRKAYGDDLSAFFGSDHADTVTARELSFTDINRHIAEMEENGYKPATIKRRIAAIRGFCEWLVALGVLTRNPASRHVLRRVRKSSGRDGARIVLTAEQAGRLIRAATNPGPDGKQARSAPRDRALLLTLLYCVLRRSEAAAMNAQDIRTLGKYQVLDLPDTKGGADQYVKIPGHVVEEIDRMKTYYKIADGPLWRSLSNNSFGKRLSERSIYGIVDRTARRAGLPQEIGAHSLRHTGCTLAIESGASIQQVQSHARHKKIETTMVYVHQRDRLRDSAADYIRIDDEMP